MEKTEVKELLHGEIQEEFEKLQDVEFGTEEYKTSVDGLTKLVDRLHEIDKSKIENNLKIKQMEEEKKDRRIKNGIAIGGIVLPVGVTIWGALKSWQFEEKGTVTSTFGRMFMNCFRLKK